MTQQCLECLAMFHLLNYMHCTCPVLAAALNRAVEVFTAGALEDKAAAAGAHHASGDGSSATGEDVSNTNGVAGQAALRAVAAKVAQLEELLTQLSPKVSCPSCVLVMLLDKMARCAV
jgi:hypothetical protein